MLRPMHVPILVSLINSSLRRGVERNAENGNRFSGWPGRTETVETVSALVTVPYTLLKQGVNEMHISGFRRRCDYPGRMPSALDTLTIQRFHTLTI